MGIWKGFYLSCHLAHFNSNNITLTKNSGALDMVGMPAVIAQEADKRTVKSLRTAWSRESKSLSENQKEVKC